MQRVLILDIETSPLEVRVWGTRDQNISLNQITKDWSVLSFAAKWLGDPPSKMIYRDTRSMSDVRDDRQVLRAVWHLLDEADIVITQNGAKFDSRKLNARFILNGMKPPSPYRHWDTYQILSRVADFTSDKLEYYTEKICTKYKKLKHAKFPGMELWNACLARNPHAWAEMRTYNIHDVLSTEELYLKVRGWSPKTAPAIHDDRGSCVECGSKRLQSRGSEKTRSFEVARLHCQDCGKWNQGERTKRVAA